jgi:aminoglycoside phosphotransferase (APT) family kinase protein
MHHAPATPHAVDATETAPAALQEAAQTFFPDLTGFETIPGHPHLLKVTTPTGLWRVRQWPETTPVGDIAFSHDVMTAAREAGLLVVPELNPPPHDSGDSALRLHGLVYDAQRWLPGHPPPRAETAWPQPEDRIDLATTLSVTALTEVIAAAAHLHEATASLAERRGAPVAPLHLLPGAVRQAYGRHLGALRARARHEPAIQRWLATGERLMANAEPILSSATQDRHLPASVLHLGLWPAHVLLEGDKLSGLLGWDRVASGSPLLDLTQATLRLQGWGDEAIETAIATYGDIRPLSPEERRLLPAVAALDAVATTGRLLEQTFAVAETSRPPSALRAAIEMMLRSMSALDRNLSEPEKRRRTPWRRTSPHAPRREGGKSRERRR